MSVIDNMLNALPPIDKKNRNYVLGGILLGIFLVYYFAILGPQLKTLRTVGPKVTILKQDIKKTNEDFQKVDHYRREVKKFEGQLNGINERVKTKEEVPMILKNISLIANSHDLSVDQMMPLVDSQELLLKGKDGKYFSLPILIEARSSYHDFGRFLNELEIKGTPLAIERFSISANPKSRLLHSVRLTVSAVIFEEKTKEAEKK